MMGTDLNNPASWIYYGSLVAAGLGLAGSAIYSFVRGAQSRAWSRTFGKITQSSVISVSRRDDFAPASRGFRTTFFIPKIHYEYQVVGNKYQAEQIRFPNPEYRSQGLAAQVARHYAVGSQVTVYYNPDSPDVPALKPGRNISTFSLILYLLLGVILLALIPFLIWFFRLAAEAGH